jgi:hypothetical protein
MKGNGEDRRKLKETEGKVRERKAKAWAEGRVREKGGRE